MKCFRHALTCKFDRTSLHPSSLIIFVVTASALAALPSRVPQLLAAALSPPRFLSLRQHRVFATTPPFTATTSPQIGSPPDSTLPLCLALTPAMTQARSPSHTRRVQPPRSRKLAAASPSFVSLQPHHRSPCNACSRISDSARACIAFSSRTSARRRITPILPYSAASAPPPPSAASPPPLLLLLHACCRRREPLFAAAPLTPPRRRTSARLQPPCRHTSARRRTPTTAAAHRRSPTHPCCRLAAVSPLRSAPHLRTVPACIRLSAARPPLSDARLLQPPLTTVRRRTAAPRRGCVSPPLSTSPPHGARLHPHCRHTSARRRTPAPAAACRRNPPQPPRRRPSTCRCTPATAVANRCLLQHP